MEGGSWYVCFRIFLGKEDDWGGDLEGNAGRFGWGYIYVLNPFSYFLLLEYFWLEFKILNFEF